MLCHLASHVRKKKEKKAYATTFGETKSIHHFRKKKKSLLIGSWHPFNFIS